MSEFRDLWVRIAASLALLVPAIFLLAAFGVKYQLFDWGLGFGLLTLRVLPAATALTFTAGVLAIALAGLVRPRRGWRLAMFALFVPSAAIVIEAGLIAKALRGPPIHDVSTDLIDPPGFSPIVVAERAMVRGGNGLDLKNARVPDIGFAPEASGKRVTALQEAAFPDIRPIPTGAPPGRALAASRIAARQLGWTIDRVDEQAGIVEARETSFWYGVTADIVVRVTPALPGSVVDVRSVSRVGIGDLGANAARVRAFSQTLAKELSAG